MSARIKYRDEQGQEHELDEDRIRKIAWTDAAGEQHEVEGHVYRKGLLEQEGDVEGHRKRFWRDDQGTEHELTEPFRITYLDDDGNEQEVEGHMKRVSDLRLKRDVRMLSGALDGLRTIR